MQEETPGKPVGDPKPEVLDKAQANTDQEASESRPGIFPLGEQPKKFNA